MASCKATKRHHWSSARAVSARRMPMAHGRCCRRQTKKHTQLAFLLYILTYVHYIVCLWYVDVGKFTTQKCSDTRETCRLIWPVGKKIGDISPCRRHVADMSPTLPAKENGYSAVLLYKSSVFGCCSGKPLR